MINFTVLLKWKEGALVYKHAVSTIIHANINLNLAATSPRRQME